ncbi:peptidoglycan-binding domain-containing protein [Cellulomonas sp. URHB0016]
MTERGTTPMHDDQFTATGTHPSSGFPGAAFSTEPHDRTTTDWGVRVLARRCGVVGQTSGGGIAGVYGNGHLAQFGVLGTAFAPRIGVVGVSVQSTAGIMNLHVPPETFELDALGAGSGTGVFGRSGSSLGVHGMSDSGTAVLGTSTTGLGSHGASAESTGVLGTSESGWGVHGSSARSVGGVFESRDGPQVRLLPRPMVSPEGHVAGAGGELLATTTGATCRLWFCTRAGDEESAEWYLVAGSRPFPGVTLSAGATGNDVKRVQMRLNVVFGSQLDGDGELGPITAEAVAAFQAQQRVPRTGEVDAVTWERLFALA